MFLHKLKQISSNTINKIFTNRVISLNLKNHLKFNGYSLFKTFSTKTELEKLSNKPVTKEFQNSAQSIESYNYKENYDPSGDYFSKIRKNNPIMNQILKQEENALSFKEFKFIPEIYHVLENLKFHAPTSIQSVAIPKIMIKKHIFYSSQTGTGKTLTYILPIINELKLQEKALGKRLTCAKRPRVLILVPSRELAQQVEEVCKLFVYDVPLVVESFYVGKDFGVEKEASQKGIDILVTTPERFKNHWNKGNVYTTRLVHFVVDELDTLLDSGYGDFLKMLSDNIMSKNEEDAEDIKGINNNSKNPENNAENNTDNNLTIETKPSLRQLIYISTTLTTAIDSYLQSIFQNKSEFLKIIDKSTNHNLSNVKHEFLHVTEYDKYPTLVKILKDNEKLFKQNMSVIIFCNNVSCARKTELILSENNFKTSCLHGEIPPLRRRFELQKFKNRRSKILVCTDLIARGLDFPFVFLVINFDFPKTLSDYLHRAGRTGRYGRNGVVVSFYRNFDLFVIEKIKKAHQLNLPMEIQNSMYSIRKAIGEPDKKSSHGRKRVSQGIRELSFNNFSKKSEEGVIARLRQRKENLEKFRIKSQSDREIIIRKMNERNQKKMQKKNKLNRQRIKLRKKIY